MLEKVGMKMIFVCGVAVVLMATTACGWLVVSGIKDDIQFYRHNGDKRK